MSFESFAHVPITEEFLRHVWEGESDVSQGGHRYGRGREGKTEFPEHWDLVILELAIRLTLSRPQAVRIKKPFVYCDRVVGGVFIRVRIVAMKGKLRAVTAYPICGEGVSRNQSGRRIFLPLDLSQMET